MLTILDLNGEFAKLRMLRGRTPETPEADRKGAFSRLTPYRDSAINVANSPEKGRGSGTRTATKSCRSSTAPRPFT